MKIKYDSESDVLMIIFKDDPPVDAIEEPGGVIVSYNEKGEPVSIEFLNASLHNLIPTGELNIIIPTTSK